MAIFTPELIEKLKIGYYFWPIFVVCSCIVYVIHYFIVLWRVKRALRWIPSPPSGIPILGNALNFAGKSASDHWRITTEWIEKYGEIVLMWIFHRPTIVVSKKEVAERLLKGTADTLTRKSEHYSFLSDIFGTSLLTYSAIAWYSRRELMNSFFQHVSMQGSLSTVVHHAKALVSHLRDKTKNSEIIDILEYSKISTLDVTVDSLMKASPNFLENSDQSYIDAINTTKEILLKRSCTPMYNWNIFYLFTLTRKLQSKAVGIINDFADKVIQKRKKARTSEKELSNQEKKKECSNLLDFLLDKEDEKILKGKEVQNEINTFLFAAHETVATGIAFTLYLIGRHPEIQENLLKEIQTVLPDISSEKEPSLEKLNKLELLGRCIRESLRLYPPVPYIGRSLKNYLKIDGDNKFPEGADVIINIYKLHRNEKYYTNPDHFNPDRFIDVNEDTEDFSYIPFGAGWRSCIGQKFAILEMKIIVAHILSQYYITSIDKPEDLEITGNIILRANNGLKMRFKQRN